jgi:hypothetical protein
MPETIGALIIAAAVSAEAATATFVVAGVTISYASVVGAVVLAAAEFAISSLLTPSPKATDGQLTLQQPVPFRRRAYGRVKISGYYMFWTSKNGILYSVVAFASQLWDAIEEYWLGDRRVTLDGGGNVTAVNYPPNANVNQFNPGGFKAIQIFSRLGTATQAAYAALITAFPTLWTVNHKGIGIADALLVEKGVSQGDFSTVYPGGSQPLKVVARTGIVWDPRDGTQDPNDPTTWKWSDNAICVILDYLTHPDGWRINRSYFTGATALPITKAAMDICDELVPLKSGGTEKRYRIWGFYGFDEEPRQVLARMLAVCGGWLQTLPDGTIAIRAGAWIEPTVTLTDKDILGYEIQHFVGEFDAINEVRATFTYPANDYQDTDSTPWQNLVDIAERGYIKSTNIDARYSPSYSQTRRIQKIGYYEASPDFSITLTTNYAGVQCRNKRFINLNLTQLGLTGSFRLTSLIVNLQTGVCTIGLASFTADAYAWDPSTEEGDAPPIPPDSSSEGLTETPANLTVSVQTAPITGGSVGPVMVISCDTPADRTDLTVTFEYEIATSTNWQLASKGTTNYQTSTPILQDGTYNVRASFFTPSGVKSAFATVNGVIVSAALAVPAVPTEIDAVPNSTAGHVLLTMGTPASSTFAAGRFWRHNINTFAGSTDISGPIPGGPSAALSFDDAPGSGTWYYWATAENANGGSSAATGPASITV